MFSPKIKVNNNNNVPKPGKYVQHAISGWNKNRHKMHCDKNDS